MAKGQVRSNKEKKKPKQEKKTAAVPSALGMRARASAPVIVKK